MLKLLTAFYAPVGLILIAPAVGGLRTQRAIRLGAHLPVLGSAPYFGRWNDLPRPATRSFAISS